MTSAKDMQLNEFTSDLASSKSAPGGGSAAALQGAIGAGLIAMVCSLTLRSNNPQQYIELNKDAVGKCKKIQQDLLSYIDADMQEVNNYFRNVMTLPKDTDEQKAARKDAMQTAFKALATPPLNTIRACYEAAKILESVFGKSYAMAQSDLGCAASSLISAAECAWLNVKANTD